MEHPPSNGRKRNGALPGIEKVMKCPCDKGTNVLKFGSLTPVFKLLVGTIGGMGKKKRGNW
jgi:hypothetical protein